MVEAELFDHKILFDCMQELLLKIDDPTTQPFFTMLREIMKIFKQMGGTLSMAFVGLCKK